MSRIWVKEDVLGKDRQQIRLKRGNRDIKILNFKNLTALLGYNVQLSVVAFWCLLFLGRPCG